MIEVKKVERNCGVWKMKDSLCKEKERCVEGDLDWTVGSAV